MSSYRGFTNKLEGYSYSPLEVVIAVILIVVLGTLLDSNYKIGLERAAYKKSYRAYDQIKQALFRDMSSATPTNRFMMKNIIGPGPLPQPLEEIFLDDGIVLNYLVRIYERSLRGVPKDQLRYQVTHKDSNVVLQYTEINGKILEQTLSKNYSN